MHFLFRSMAVLGFYASNFFLILAYIHSLMACYAAHGLWWTLLVAIPPIGQILWFFVTVTSAGWYNPYATLIYCAALCYLFAVVFNPGDSRRGYQHG